MKKARTIVVADENKDLFRIHFYDDCIKFDLKFAEVISENDELTSKVIEINKSFYEHKIDFNNALSEIAILIDKNADKFEPFYFKDYELNKDGRYVDLVPIDSAVIEMNKKAHDFYQYLLFEGVLSKITKKEFESNLIQEIYKELYVEGYSKIHNHKGVVFYQYKLNDNFGGKTCNIIATEKEVLFGYTF